MMGYGVVTWMPTILVSKGFSLTDAGLWLSITGFAGSAFGIAAPYFASKLKDFRLLLSLLALTLTISMAAFTVDSGWHLIFWLFISNFGFAFILYLVLWIVIPSSATVVIGSQRKRFFRDTDDKIIGGVCSGISQYFGINVWIPRLLFLLPFLSFGFNFSHNFKDSGIL